MDEKASGARCAGCPAEVNVPASYAHGDIIRCGICGTSLRVVRGDRLRLVPSDLAPLKSALDDLAARRERLEDELRGARGHLGFGLHGLWIGLIYVLYQVTLNEHGLSVALLASGVGISILCAVLLEVLNFLFMAKRIRIERLSSEIEELQQEETAARHRLREATRR
jgi:hypothetical protein